LFSRPGAGNFSTTEVPKNDVADDLEDLAATLATVLRFLNRTIERKVVDVATALHDEVDDLAGQVASITEANKALVESVNASDQS
jgi:hypothetical protein